MESGCWALVSQYWRIIGVLASSRAGSGASLVASPWIASSPIVLDREVIPCSLPHGPQVDQFGVYPALLQSREDTRPDGRCAVGVVGYLSSGIGPTLADRTPRGRGEAARSRRV